MSDGGTRIPLPSRSFSDSEAHRWALETAKWAHAWGIADLLATELLSLVRPPVDQSMSPRSPDPAFDAAGAHEPEPDTPEGVAAVPFLVDTQLYGSYDDAMSEHGTRARYVHRKCRCEECARANREYQRVVMARRYVPATDTTPWGYRCRDGTVTPGWLSRWQAQR